MANSDQVAEGGALATAGLRNAFLGALAGGALWMIDQRLAGAGPGTLDDLFPKTLRFLLTPYVEPEPGGPAG